MKKTKSIQPIMITLCVLFICSCSHSFSKINTIDFVTVDHSVILKSENSIISQPNITVAFNKYYNEAALPTAFVNQYRTDTISYKSQMAIECFLGNQSKFRNVDIDKILENKSEIRIYFKAMISEVKDSFYQPFVIAKMHKVRKKVSFFLNDEDLNTSLQNVYVQ